MKQVSIVLASRVGAANLPHSAMAQQRGSPDGWEVGAGAGVVSTPDSLGSKQHTITVPALDVRCRDWFFAHPVDGVGVQTNLNGSSPHVERRTAPTFLLFGSYTF